MPAKKEDTAEFKEQAVRFVLEEIEPDESRKHACDRLAPRLSVKAVTLYNWGEAVDAGKGPPLPEALRARSVCVGVGDERGVREPGPGRNVGEIADPQPHLVRDDVILERDNGVEQSVYGWTFVDCFQ
jgi:transposase-like protein